MTELADRFTRMFDERPDLVVRSPGRVNLIGEHTDYNDGWVLPAALDLGTEVAARRRRDGQLRVITYLSSGAEPGPAEDLVAVADLRPTEGPQWTRYVRGSAALVAASGVDIAADLLIDSNLPIGGGLSSSASLELGVVVALLALAGQSLEPVELARLGRRVENEIVGVQSGIMDQLAVAGGVDRHALLIDCRSLAVEPVPIPAEARIVVVDSAAPRTLAGSAYNQRRAECEAASRALGVPSLRDVSTELLAAARLSDVEFRRARHVVTENQRVLASVAALRAGDLTTFGQHMAASHASLRDDYEVSSRELDTLVEIAAAVPGVFGARLTGAGFGGCAVALAAATAAESAATTITERYHAATGLPSRAWICTPSQGTHVRS